jgi:hypothetical protein
MQIIEQYPLQVEKWEHLQIDKFSGTLFENGYSYNFGITPQDPMDYECCYVNIWIGIIIVNKNANTTVFKAQTYSCFKIQNENRKPSTEFCFELTEKATFDFAKEFHVRTNGTNLQHHKIHKPQLTILKDDIEKTLDFWEANYKEKNKPGSGKIPNWQSTFRDLPEIPEHKKWEKGVRATKEQAISTKLMNRIPITDEEEMAFKELSNFYEELDKKLTILDYQSFTEVDFENFKNYILYAFNYLALVSNNLTVLQTYRLVVNESVTGKNESITDVVYLKYPPLDIVKASNKYNRANTPSTNIFYSTENIDTALKEIKPPLNKLVTVGVWKPKDIKKKLVSFPISHSDTALPVNEGVHKSTKAFEEQGEHVSPLFMNFMRYYFKLLGREYTKPIKHHYEYIITALFSEQILDRQAADDERFKYDCMLYPSVGNDFITENLAILPTTLDKDFVLTEVIEFEVEEAYYDKKYTLEDYESITLAKVKNLRRTKNINPDGKIEW